MRRKPDVIGCRSNGTPMLWAENLEDGDSVVCESSVLRRASAWMARQRLRNVIRADRAAVPCGRWEATGRCFPQFAGRSMTTAELVASYYDRRPRYRYEVRR